MDVVTVDILSGLPATADGMKYLLVVVDHFSKWLEAFPLPDQEAATCLRALYNGFFARFGLPRQLHSDQGRNFESTLVKGFCTMAGVVKSRTTPFHPRGDGLTERANRTILQMLRSSVADHPSDWPDRLPALLAAYRMTRHSVTGVSPNEAMLGREVLLPATLIAAPPREAEEQFSPPELSIIRDRLRDAHSRVRVATQSTARAEKTVFDQRVRRHTFSVGDAVWLFWPRPVVRQRHRKLTQPWTGPWVVTQIHGSLVVDIRHKKNGRTQRVHVDRLLPCRSQSGRPAQPAEEISPQIEEAEETSEPEAPDVVEDPFKTPVRRSLRTRRVPARYR